MHGASIRADAWSAGPHGDTAGHRRAGEIDRVCYGGDLKHVKVGSFLEHMLKHDSYDLDRFLITTELARRSAHYAIWRFCDFCQFFACIADCPRLASDSRGGTNERVPQEHGRWTMGWSCWRPVALALFVFAVAAVPAVAQVDNQIVPIAVYNSIAGDAFGVGVDSGSGILYVNPSGGGTIFSYKSYASFTAAEVASLPVVGGVQQIDPGGAGAFAGPGYLGMNTPNIAAFEALGFDGAIGKIVMNDASTGTLRSVTPVTGATAAYSPIGTGSFFDGLDVSGSGDIYASPEDGSRDSYKNGAVFLDNTNPLQTTLPTFAPLGAGPHTITRWAGVAQAGADLYAVAEVDFGASRTIARYDAATGALLGYDFDGEPFASRFEDLAFDGRYLYGADLFGSRVFVVDITGPGGLNPVPEPASGVLLGLGAMGAFGVFRRWRKGESRVAA